MPKESAKATITSFAGTPLVRVVDGANSRNISPANLVAESGAQTALDGRYAPLANSRQFVSYRSFTEQTGSPTVGQVDDGTQYYNYLSLVNGSTRVAIADFIQVPYHWATFTVHELTINPTAGSGNVALDRRISPFYGPGDIPPITGLTTLSNTVKAAGTAHQSDGPTQVGSAITNVPGEFFSLYIRRNTASDTLAAAYGFLGFELRAASFS